MDITPVLTAGAQAVESCHPGGFRIAGRVVTGAVWVSPQATAAAPVSRYDQLTPAHLESLLAPALEKPEVVLIGAGAKYEGPPPPTLRAAARAAGVVLEIMTTGAACRTWNVLLGEGRRAAALLFPPETAPPGTST